MLGVFLAAGAIAAADSGEEGAAFFAEEVHPILEENCFECHGGGDELKGEFRITSRDGLLRGGHYGPAWDAENPADSVLLDMISYRDADHQMPPDAKLPDGDIAVLTEWMERGAPYDPSLEIEGSGGEGRHDFTVTEEGRDWWAYRPVSDPEPPEVEETGWVANGIDAFIKAGLEREGLSPNPTASPRVLIRRLFYDLVGLPPTPEESDDFVAAWERDPEAAWTEAVEELLSRPQYGEKWARHWLDVVRYAESNGFERDNPKPHIWRYRDWVVDAFNEDKPYDRFVIEQLAGDEIAEPTMESMVATGYHRLMQWDDEPADRKQHVYDVLADNVQVTSEAFLATTIGCARCHDHKADPFSQEDYYAFMACFHGVTHYRTQGTLVSWASPEEERAFEERRDERLAGLRQEREQLGAELHAALRREGLVEEGGSEGITFLQDARNGGEDWFYTTETPTDDWSSVGFRNKSWYKGRGGFGREGTPGSVVGTPWKSENIWMRATFGLRTLPESLVLEIHHDEDVEVYLNGGLVYEAKGFTTDYETVVLSAKALERLQTGKNVVAVHCRQTRGGQYIDLSLGTRGSAASLEKRVTGKEGKKLARMVKEATGRDLVGDYRSVLDDIAHWRQAEPGTKLNVVTSKGPEPPPLHVHLRGSAHAPGEKVAPGLPAVLAGDGSEPRELGAEPVRHADRASPGRRLALARWIASSDNPLTARVMVNRIWQHHFGRGIVRRPNNFGQLGVPPTHPELLDWLATEFVRLDWRMKPLHRLMLHSRTYRMSSKPHSGNLSKDPQNRRWWRYSMRRLTAEELRDSMLAVAGNLNLETGGQWVNPPLPEEVLATASRPDKVWPVSKAEEDHVRRSLYVHVKRSLRHPLLSDFDQATTDSPCAVRFTTTVPTQALTMLNSGFVNDQAGIFAERMRRRGDAVRDRVAAGLELALQRPAEAGELDDLVSLHQRLRTEAGLSPEDALDRVALVILNLNEFVYLD